MLVADVFKRILICLIFVLVANGGLFAGQCLSVIKGFYQNHPELSRRGLLKGERSALCGPVCAVTIAHNLKKLSHGEGFKNPFDEVEFFVREGFPSATSMPVESLIN